MNELINHLWQSTAFVLLIALAAKALQRNSPRLRYWLWLTASIKFLIPFSLIVAIGARIQLPPETPLPRANTVMQISTYFEPASEKYFEPSPEVRFEPASAVSAAVPVRAEFPWRLVVATVWLMGGFVLAVRWFRRWWTIYRAVGRATRLPIQSSVPILSSPALMEPGVFGLFRQVLVLPEGIAEKLTPKQFEAVLAHELRHVRCFDNLTAAVHMGIETLFWLHPLVWWIGAKLMDERERDCDEAVLRQGSQPADYARGILQVCEMYAKTELPCASGVSGSDLKNRVQEIMRWRGSLPVTLRGKAILISAAIAAVSLPFLIGVLRAQTDPMRVQNSQLAAAQPPARPETVQAQSRPEAPPNIVGDYIAVLSPPGPERPPESLRSAVRPGEVPKWDAVSIRPCSPPPTTGAGARGARGAGPDRAPFTFSADRMTLNCLSIRSLIRSAYHVYVDVPFFDNFPMDEVLSFGTRLFPGGNRKIPDDRTDGGPDWIDTDGYMIEAKAQGVTDRALMQGPMLQAILEDRFKIKVHRETREMAVDALVIARGGSKLKPFVEGSCVRRTASNDSTPPPFFLQIKADSKGKLSGTLEHRAQIRPLTDVRVEGQSLSFSDGGFNWKGSIEDNGGSLKVALTGGDPMPLVFRRQTAPTSAGEQHDCRIGRNVPLGNSMNFVVDAQGVTIDEFVKRFLDGVWVAGSRFVIDKTGLAGKFDIHLESEIGAEIRQQEDPTGDLFGPSTAPPLPEALQQQLGLRLESTKGPVEFLVIDHIERPSPN